MTDVVLVDGTVLTLKEAQDLACEQGRAVMLQNGGEVCCPVPVAPPIGFSEGPSLMDQVRNLVLREIALQEDLVVDTAEEAEDFDVGDGFEPFTRHEIEGLSREELIEEARLRGMVREEKPVSEAPGVTATPSKPNPPAAVEGGEGGASPKKAPPPAPAGA